MVSEAQRWTFDVSGKVRAADGSDGTRTFCTQAHGQLETDGSWVLRIVPADGKSPIIELAGDSATSVGSIRETITTALHQTTANPNQP